MKHKLRSGADLGEIDRGFTSQSHTAGDDFAESRVRYAIRNGRNDAVRTASWRCNKAETEDPARLMNVSLEHLCGVHADLATGHC